MPGLVKMIACKEGDSVEAGTTVVILEAMKMQNPLFAPVTGVVRHSVIVHMYACLSEQMVGQICQGWLTYSWMLCFRFCFNFHTFTLVGKKL